MDLMDSIIVALAVSRCSRRRRGHHASRRIQISFIIVLSQSRYNTTKPYLESSCTSTAMSRSNVVLPSHPYSRAIQAILQFLHDEGLTESRDALQKEVYVGDPD